MERLLQDVRYGTKSLQKSKRFTVAAVLTLALGIGANSAMFSVIRAVLLKPWGYPEPERLMVVSQRDGKGNTNVFSTQDFLDWKQQGGLLATMGAHVQWQFNLSRLGEPAQRITGGQVSSDLLPTLGVQPMLGRVFSAQEDKPGAGQFVVLSYAFWHERLGGDARIVGQSIQLDGVPHVVVGVMPQGFVQNDEMLWTPLQLNRDSGLGASPNIHWLLGFVRLPKGMNLKEAKAQLDGTAERVHRQNATSAEGFGVELQTFNDAFTGDAKPALLMLMGCVGFVLLIACVNVANLLLGRGVSRFREIAVRTALGASRTRIVRQLLTESVILATAGCVAGVGVAFLLLRGMLAIHPPQVPRMEQTGLDAVVLGYSLLVSVVVGILFGLAPALDAAKVDINAGLRERGSSAGRGFGRQRSILVISETALACMLLIGAGLALRSLWSLRSVELGFVPDNLLSFRIAAPAQLKGAQIAEFYRQVVARVRSAPGVQQAATARDLPLSDTDPSMPIETEGKATDQNLAVTRFRAVGDGYFRTLGISVLQGRVFKENDTASAAAVAMVSESVAKEYWPGESAIGKRIKPKFAGSPWYQVVGVAADVRHKGSSEEIEPTTYYPYTQIPEAMLPLVESYMTIAVRSSLAQGDLLRSVEAAVAAVDSNTPVYDVKTMNAMVAESGSLRNFDFTLLFAFSMLALSLAAVGVYAVMAYSVSQRTKEIGVRIALGADARNIRRLILRHGALLAVAGSVLGVVGALLLQKAMASFIYGVSWNDPIVMLLVPCIMILVVLAACWIPARRATKIDPMMALRCE
jgi:predicted permease